MNRTSLLNIGKIEMHSRCLMWKCYSPYGGDYCKSTITKKPLRLIKIPKLFINIKNYANSKPKHDFKRNKYFQGEHYDGIIKQKQDQAKQPLELALKNNALYNQDNSTEVSIKCEDRLMSLKAHKTSVNKYSPVPSLPRSSIYKLAVEIPKEPSTEEIPSVVQRFFLGRFRKYLEKFHQSLANEMPDTFHMFSTFTKGFKEFVIDFRDYITVGIKLSLPFYNLEDLGRRELELYFNMPRQMIRVFPVVAISSLPFAQNFVLPFAYMFPRHLLCYQFWDANQRQEFPVARLRKRLFNARPVFRSLQSRVDEIEDCIMRRKCQSIFFSLGSGVHPTRTQITDIKDLFTGEPFHLNLLYAQHVNGLLRLHGRSAWLRRRKRLREHARYIHCMDNALQKERLSSLNSEQLRQMMILRGINPTGMSCSQMTAFLETWLIISGEINEKGFSLLLHLPIFMAYNYPMNLHLIYT